jgi:hypothetical protein
MRHLALAIALAAWLFLPATAHAGAEHMPGWVGLWNTEMLDWLENGNRMHRLCPESLSAKERGACRKRLSAPKSWHIPLSETPGMTAASGWIVITATPGEGLAAAYVDREKTSSISFTPDLYDQDWGYGPYFDQTFLDYSNGWFLLPRGPFPVPLWANIGWTIGEENIRAVVPGEVYLLGDRSIVIERVALEEISAREEEPRDMWCEEGVPPQRSKGSTFSFRPEDIISPDGHLLLKLKYTRGC